MGDNYERNREQRAQGNIHSTLETVHIEQGEARQGHIPDPTGADVVPPEPTLLQRILKALGLRR